MTTNDCPLMTCSSCIDEEKMSDVGNDCPKTNCISCNEDYHDVYGDQINEQDICSNCLEHLQEEFKNGTLSDYDFFDEFGIFPTKEILG